MALEKRALIVTLLLISVCGCSQSVDSETSRNVEAVALQHTEVWSNGNVGLISTIYTEDYIGHSPGGRTIRGRDGIQSTVENHRVAFPDWIEEVEAVIADGNLIATRYTSRGTHLGMFLGHPPTGNEVEIAEASIYRMVDGRIAEQWTFPDVLSLLDQLSSDQAE